MASSGSGVRSLVCDSNGIIIAEMVYRCMICSQIHDVLDDAQHHYQSQHIDSDHETNDDKHHDNKHHDKHKNNKITPLNDDEEEDDDDTNCMTNEPEICLPEEEPLFDDVSSGCTSSAVTVAVPASLRQLQYQSWSSSQSPQSILAGQSSEQMNRGSAKPIAFASPSSAILMPISSSSSTASPKRIGGGFVTCEVCGLTKYYSHISRRYGVFSCESCAKFFYRYLLKPSKFTCPSNGNCSLKIDVPGGRCKACLLQACLQKYIIDPKRHPKIFEKSRHGPAAMLPITTTSSPVPASVQIKLNKQSNKISITPPSQQPANKIKQEVDYSETSFESPKPSTNGLVIMPSSGSVVKRKQHEDGVGVTKSRRIGCRECPGCLADDCGSCLYCLDKPKFGGNDVKKQRCIKRRCHRSNYS